MHPVLCINVHHDVIDSENHEMVKNTKIWISWEWNITFLYSIEIMITTILKGAPPPWLSSVLGKYQKLTPRSPKNISPEVFTLSFLHLILNGLNAVNINSLM